MKPDFDYNLVPYRFLHCLNGQCMHAADCLRHQVSLRLPVEHEAVTIVNPARIALVKEDCPYFMPDRLQRFALGITRLFDSIPHADAVIIKRQMIAHFKTHMYYRFFRKERLITPAGQEYIRQLFLHRGLKEEPVYDEFVEQYDWSGEWTETLNQSL